MNQTEKELLDALEDCVMQACWDPVSGEVDSMALSAYAEAMRILAKHGLLQITDEVGRRVIAERLTPPSDIDVDNPRWGGTRGSTDDADLWRVVPWRIGRSLGRTIYFMVGEEPSKDDHLIGMVDKVEVAEHIVDLHNAQLDEGEVDE